MEINNLALIFLKALLWGLSIFHIVIGVGLTFSQRLQKKLIGLYGARVEWTPQFVYLVRTLGSFILVLGVFLAIAAADPLFNRAIIYGFVFLFILRDILRIVYHKEILSAFSLSKRRNDLTNVFFLGLTLLMLILLFAAGS